MPVLSPVTVPTRVTMILTSFWALRTQRSEFRRHLTGQGYTLTSLLSFSPLMSKKSRLCVTFCRLGVGVGRVSVAGPAALSSHKIILCQFDSLALSFREVSLTW